MMIKKYHLPKCNISNEYAFASNGYHDNIFIIKYLHEWMSWNSKINHALGTGILANILFFLNFKTLRFLWKSTVYCLTVMLKECLRYDCIKSCFILFSLSIHLSLFDHFNTKVNIETAKRHLLVILAPHFKRVDVILIYFNNTMT